VPDHAVKILHAVKLSIFHCVKQRLSISFAGFYVFTSSRAGTEYFNCRNSTALVRSGNQALGDNVAERLSQTSSYDRFFILRVETDYSIDGFGGIYRVQCRKNQVTGLRCLKRDFSGLEISHFANENHFWRLAQRSSQRGRKILDVVSNLALVDR